jgi:hypothetical protein
VIAEAGRSGSPGAAPASPDWSTAVRRPGHPDGSASFPASGGAPWLITNHEQSPPPTMEIPYPVPPLPGLTYDRSARVG